MRLTKCGILSKYDVTRYLSVSRSDWFCVTSYIAQFSAGVAWVNRKCKRRFFIFFSLTVSYSKIEGNPQLSDLFEANKGVCTFKPMQHGLVRDCLQGINKWQVNAALELFLGCLFLTGNQFQWVSSKLSFACSECQNPSDDTSIVLNQEAI